MRSVRSLAFGIFVLAAAAGGVAFAQDPGGFELILTEEGSETPDLDHGEQVTLVIPDLEEATLAKVPEGLFVDQEGQTVVVEPGGSIYTIDEVDDGAYTVTAYRKAIPLVAVINVSSTKKPK